MDGMTRKLTPRAKMAEPLAPERIHGQQVWQASLQTWTAPAFAEETRGQGVDLTLINLRPLVQENTQCVEEGHFFGREGSLHLRHLHFPWWLQCEDGNLVPAGQGKNGAELGKDADTPAEPTHKESQAILRQCHRGLEFRPQFLDLLDLGVVRIIGVP